MKDKISCRKEKTRLRNSLVLKSSPNLKLINSNLNKMFEIFQKDVINLNGYTIQKASSFCEQHVVTDKINNNVCIIT